jgi:hypothetical protein
MDGLMMHSSVGTLATLDASQIMPASAVTTDPLMTSTGHLVLSLERTQHFAAGILWALVPFYPPAGVTPHAGDLVAGLLSYVTCILPVDEVMGQQEMTEALNYGGLAPQWREMTPSSIEEFQNEQTLEHFRMFSASVPPRPKPATWFIWSASPIDW